MGNKHKKIVLTGGGSAGHVTPNLALIPELINEGWEIHYIGTSNGIEKDIIPKEGVTYHTVHSGKLRRYFDIKNLTDPFKVIYGAGEATSIIRKIKPQVIFSKGGFVSVPVVIGGWLNRIPIITPGLANKMTMPFATKICVTFPQSKESLPAKKVVYTGTPIRRDILEGSYEEGLRICGFNDSKPIIMIMGGSLGSRNLNNLIREQIQRLTRHFQVVHICGKGNIDEKLLGIKEYKQFEYIGKEQPHIFKAASLIISRAGANSIFEFLTLRLPNLLIPLSLNASRGDQILNAKYFEKMGFSKVMYEEELNSDLLYNGIIELYKDRNMYIENMKKSTIPQGNEEIMKLINKYAKA